VEAKVVAIRREHPAWGGRKIHHRLLALGQAIVPAPSTITGILHRHGLMDPAESAKHKPFVRFEHEHPNDLWQMDFMGHFPLAKGRCYPLTVLDDCSRFSIAVRACPDERGLTVKGHLTDMFRRYGLPRRILSDNGSPWGCTGEARYTWLSAWLIHLGIRISHGRPYHPQTQGKDERFHRTLKAELPGDWFFQDNAMAQERFDRWRDVYNMERPHEALDMATPASRYQSSPRPFPEVLPSIEYADSDITRKVGKDGYFQYRRRTVKVSQAFAGYRVALRRTTTDSILEVFFCLQHIATINLSDDTEA
jgi:transposase InsO family protein